jgi:hypothetical protein
MSAAQRSGKLAREVARRSIEAAERRRAEVAGPDPSEIHQRLRATADEDGRVSITDAVAAASGEREPWNPFADPKRLERSQAKNAAMGRNLFPSMNEVDEEPAPRFAGSADGGEGEPDPPEDAVFEHTDDGQRFRVWDLDSLD